MMSSHLIVAQSAGPGAGGESWLMGVFTVPFPVVSAVVGLVVLGTLVYFARRLSER